MQANFQLNADELGLPLVEKIKAMFAHQSIRISVVPADEPVNGTAPRLADLKRILEELPRLSKEDADAFARDIEDARKILNAEPMRDPWQS
jgi:hypothetical protein